MQQRWIQSGFVLQYLVQKFVGGVKAVCCFLKSCLKRIFIRGDSLASVRVKLILPKRLHFGQSTAKLPLGSLKPSPIRSRSIRVDVSKIPQYLSGHATGGGLLHPEEAGTRTGKLMPNRGFLVPLILIPPSPAKCSNGNDADHTQNHWQVGSPGFVFLLEPICQFIFLGLFRILVHQLFSSATSHQKTAG